ncbi:MAG TPA: hypothetical protein VJT09_09395, partial [Pyrinomonadaceae bacterium]|nr:hypothetical protein [Pyrinomonadaceae bacterium]
MRRILQALLAACALLALTSCSKSDNTAGNSNQPANTNAAQNSTANANAPGAPKRYDVVFALKGPRQPSDNKIAEQKREFVNMMIPNYITGNEYGTLNLDQKFKDVTNLGLKDDERVYVITLAAPVGKKIEKGEYQAYGDDKPIESIPANEGFAIISRYDASGVKRTTGTVKVTVADNRLVMVLFRNLGETLGLQDISYGAPYKN